MAIQANKWRDTNVLYQQSVQRNKLVFSLTQSQKIVTGFNLNLTSIDDK